MEKFDPQAKDRYFHLRGCIPPERVSIIDERATGATDLIKDFLIRDSLERIRTRCLPKDLKDGRFGLRPRQ